MRERVQRRLVLKFEIGSDMETERGVNTDMAPKCMRRAGSGWG